MDQHTDTKPYRNELKRTGQLAIWTLAWLVTLALARFGPELWWGSQPVASWAAIAVNVAAGVGWIVAFMRYLRALDELQRKIMLDALAVTLGVGWVGGFGYVVADLAGLVTGDISLGLFPALLSVVFLIAFIVGKIRYR